MFISLIGIAPLLYTLTQTTSTDTVYTISAILLFTHLFCYNYNAELAETQTGSKNIDHKLPNSLSLNSVILASVLLASRLSSVTHVFALVMFALLIFGVFPLVRLRSKQLVVQESISHYALCIIIALIIFAAVFAINIFLGLGFAASLIFLHIGCPIWLVKIQDFKKYVFFSGGTLITIKIEI